MRFYLRFKALTVLYLPCSRKEPRSGGGCAPGTRQTLHPRTCLYPLHNTPHPLTPIPSAILSQLSAAGAVGPTRKPHLGKLIVQSGSGKENNHTMISYRQFVWQFSLPDSATTGTPQTPQEQGNNWKGFKDFYLKGKARIWS